MPDDPNLHLNTSSNGSVSPVQKKRLDCPLCGGKDDAVISPGHTQALVTHCFKCDAPGKEILAALGLGPVQKPPSLPPLPKQRGDTPQKRRERLEQVLSGCKPITKGTPPWLYLERRGCLPDEHEGIPPVLLYHPHLPYYDGRQIISHNPAIIAKLEDLEYNLISLHRIYLTPDGKKAPVPTPKKLMASAAEGAAVRAAIQLDEPGCMALCIAEGIETALWLRKRSKWPFWACYCADAMRQVQIPRGVSCVYIYPDHKPQEQKAAMAGAMRLKGEGFRVKVMSPPNGQDWDDQAMEGASNAGI
jgi:hypothetical protein